MQPKVTIKWPVIWAIKHQSSGSTIALRKFAYLMPEDIAIVLCKSDIDPCRHNQVTGMMDRQTDRQLFSFL